MQPNMRQTVSLLAGQVGYVICGMKTAKVRKLGSFRVKRKFRKPLLGRLYSMLNWTGQPLLRFLVSRFAKISLKNFFYRIFNFSFQEVKPTVYSGLFPVDPADYENLKQAIERLSLNDPAVTIQPDSSAALGLGWKVGGNSDTIDFLRKF